MKLTKQRLKEIIKEELQTVLAEGYETIGHRKLRWTGEPRTGAPLDAASIKRIFHDMTRDFQPRLGRHEGLRAMMWIDKNWHQWETRPEAEEAIKDWLEAGSK